MQASLETSDLGLSNKQLLDKIDAETILKEGCFVCGSRGSGKSTLAFWITRKLRLEGIRVKVIDSSLTWKKHSDLVWYQPILFGNERVFDLDNSIYDFSRLSCLNMRETVIPLLTSELRDAITETDNGINRPLVFVLEECQNLLPSNSLRSRSFEPISRFITQGRNFDRSFLAITQRLAKCDTDLVEISGLKFFGKLEGQNNLAKAKSWLPREIIKELRNLKTGQFIKQYGSDIELIQTNPFFSNVKPRNYLKEPEVEQFLKVQELPQVEMRRPRKRPSIFQKLVSVLL